VLQHRGEPGLSRHQKDDGSLQITDETDGVVRFAITSSGTIYHGTTDRGAWHSGNDGAGSGLDADLLDGRQASDFPCCPAPGFRATGTVAGETGPAASLQPPPARSAHLPRGERNGITVTSMQSL
jgi:hypothetical protein